MNDKELISELRDFHTLCGDPYCDHGDATDSEHCAACQAEFPCSAIRAADALEARQPSEDDVLDHLALWRVMYVDESRDCDGFYPLGPFYVLASHEDEAWNFADAIPKQDWPHTTGVHEARYATDGEAAEWLASRAAVPDAATENVQKMYDRACADIQEYGETIKRIEAERDAAVAAIERVRAAVSGHPECDRYEEGDVISCGWKSAYASVVAALDGAPEPEGVWEYQWGEPGESFEGFDSFATEELARAEMEIDSDYPSHRVIRRRKAGPWLPVEGESSNE